MIEFTLNLCNRWSRNNNLGGGRSRGWFILHRYHGKRKLGVRRGACCTLYGAQRFLLHRNAEESGVSGGTRRVRGRRRDCGRSGVRRGRRDRFEEFYGPETRRLRRAEIVDTVAAFRRSGRGYGGGRGYGRGRGYGAGRFYRSIRLYRLCVGDGII